MTNEKLMLSQNKDAIELIQGHTNILLIAPHGHDEDDKNTGKLVRLIAEQSGCYAIVNEVYRRAKSVKTASEDDKRVNVNHLTQVKTHLENKFLTPLLDYKNKIVEQYGNALIFWIHGAEDLSIKGDISDKADANPKDIKVLVGWGQKKDDDRPTAKQETKDILINALNKNGLNAFQANPDKKADPKKDIRTYCGWDENNLNQIFRSGEYEDKMVESFQLEFRMMGCRDKDVSLESTARDFINSISALIQPPEKNIEPAVENNQSPDKAQVPEKTTNADDIKGAIDVGGPVYDPLVESAYQKLSHIFSKNYEQTLMEAGQYIVRTFYAGEEAIEDLPYDENLVLDPTVIKNARDKKSPKQISLNKLIEKIEGDKTSSAPSRSWIINAVNLVVQDYDIKKDLKPLVHSYGQLLLTHKICLLKVKDLTKKQVLIEEESKNTSTVKEFIQKIEKLVPPDPKKALTLPALLKKPEELVKEENAEKLSLNALKNTQARTLEKLKNITDVQRKNIETEIEDLKKDLENRQQFLERYARIKGNIEKAIQSKEKLPKMVLGIKKATEAGMDI